VPLAPLATAVAYSRIYTGVHYPSDVIAGAILGTTIGLATRSFWPVTPTEPSKARLATRAELESRDAGERVSIVVNQGAGSALSGDLTKKLEKHLPEARIRKIEESEGDDLKDALEEAANAGEVVGVSGGDGSINCAAQIAIDAGKPLLVIPGGTLNHLARDLGVEDARTAVTALKEGSGIAMDVATIDGKAFLNTASFGSYAELVDAREKLESRIGKWPAVLVAMIRVLRHGDPIEVEIDGRARKIWMIFIGNCRYHPSGFAPAWRERLDDGQLDIRIVDARPFARSRLIASVLTGRLGRSRIYEQRVAEQLKVRSLQGPLRLARDGETFDGPDEFVVEKIPKGLKVYAPVEGSRPS
jgi:diacylglycerol kinase family enzyme